MRKRATLELIPGKAIRKRHCKICRAPILPNECHFVSEYYSGRGVRQQNHCMACALPVLVSNAAYYAGYVKEARTYLKRHKDIRGRQILYKAKRR